MIGEERSWISNLEGHHAHVPFDLRLSPADHGVPGPPPSSDITCRSPGADRDPRVAPVVRPLLVGAQGDVASPPADPARRSNGILGGHSGTLRRPAAERLHRNPQAGAGPGRRRRAPSGQTSLPARTSPVTTGRTARAARLVPPSTVSVVRCGPRRRFQGWVQGRVESPGRGASFPRTQRDSPTR